MTQLLTKMIQAPRELPTISNQSGAVAVIIALSLAGLIGFVGLALDLGKLFVAKTELQNSVDACALAAARELTGANSNQLILAEAAGIATGERHRVYFQGEDIVISGVTFAVSLEDDYRSAADIDLAEAVEMRFARCEANRTDILNWFIQVLNLFPGEDIGSQAVSASAVASLVPGQTACAIPVGVCNEDAPPSTPVGTWLEGLSSKDNITGNFRLVDYSPPSGGLDELKELLLGPGACNLPIEGSEVGQPGKGAAAIAKPWNSRFGIYEGDVKEGDAIPDYSGYAYTEANWPSKFNALSDFQSKRGSNLPYQGDGSTGLRTKGTVVDTIYLQANGADRRLVTVPILDCTGFDKGATAPVQAWACVLMLHPKSNDGKPTEKMYLEYLGRSNDTGSPCATNGVPAGPAGIGPMVPALVR